MQGHELLENLRQGDWLIDYFLERLRDGSDLGENQELEVFREKAEHLFSQVKKLEATFKPKYFIQVVDQLYEAAVQNYLARVPQFLRQDQFLVALSLGTVQMMARVPSAFFLDFKETMSAGLPHFSRGFTRCWGRDTFIAFKGLLLVPGLWKEAEETLLYFASVSRHGLIPNLHDGGNNTRFNARDAVWFFVQSVADYCQMAPNGYDILEKEF